MAVLALASAGIAVYAATGSRHSRAKLALSSKVRKGLRPGTSQPIDVVLTNRYRFAVRVTRLNVSLSVRPRRRGARCSARRDFAVRQLGRRAYPIRLPPRSRRSLRSLRVRSRLLPRLMMRDLRHTNQNACKGASLRLRFAVRVRRSPRRAVRR